MDPGTYDYAFYEAQVRQQVKQHEVIVFDAVFCPPNYSSELILVAGTSSGELYFYAVGPVLTVEYWDQVNLGKQPKHPGPIFSFQAHTAQIYSLSFAGTLKNPLLISGGDQELRVWKWKSILEAIEAARHRKSHVVSIKAPIPYQTFHLQQKSLGARGALLPYSEINDLAVSSISGHIFAAGGDNIVHEWDLEAAKCLRKYEGHKEYLHSVRHLNHTQELVTGSEDGHIGLWDVRSTSKPTYLTPQQKSSSLSSSHRRVSSTTSGLYVKSVATDSSETWLASGGGKKRVADQPLSTGFMSVWHLPSRVPVYYRETPSDLYDVAFYHSDVLSVGNESSLKKWNRTSGVLLSSARSTLPGCHFCVVDETTDIVATGGYGPMIDIYTMPGVVGFSLLVEKSNVEVTSRP